jgi:hypothetical protein
MITGLFIALLLFVTLVTIILFIVTMTKNKGHKHVVGMAFFAFMLIVSGITLRSFYAINYFRTPLGL